VKRRILMDWWLIVVVVIVGVTFGMRALRARGTRTGPGNLGGSVPAVDFADDRETARVSRLSEEEREWETAALGRSREMERPASAPSEAEDDGDERTVRP
jgi:hypothetical protein